MTFTIGAPPAPTSDPALITAGDIASCGSLLGDEHTADLLGQLSGEIQTIGDNAYDHGSAADFAVLRLELGPVQVAHPSVARRPRVRQRQREPVLRLLRRRRRPVAAGLLLLQRRLVAHRRHEPGLRPGARAAVTPAARRSSGCRSDLAANPRQCTIGVVGGARFSSGGVHGNETEVKDLWKALYDARCRRRADRRRPRLRALRPADAGGVLRRRAAGMREFVVGTGGYYTYDARPQQPLSEELHAHQHGVLRLILHPGSYDWTFHSVAGSTYTDTGSGSCH